MAGPTDLSALVGTWEGTGSGTDPTIAPFGYVETATFAAVPGKPFLAYEQRTRAADDGRPLHRETGYLRPGPDGAVEWVLAQPTGHAELSTGTFDGTVLDVATTAVILSPSALEVSRLHRRYVLDGDVLRYELDMAAVGQPLQRHLVAELHRQA
jgi:hypothetical protein